MIYFEETAEFADIWRPRAALLKVRTSDFIKNMLEYKGTPLYFLIRGKCQPYLRKFNKNSHINLIFTRPEGFLVENIQLYSEISPRYRLSIREHYTEFDLWNHLPLQFTESIPEATYKFQNKLAMEKLAKEKYKNTFYLRLKGKAWARIIIEEAKDVKLKKYKYGLRWGVYSEKGDFLLIGDLEHYKELKRLGIYKIWKGMASYNKETGVFERIGKIELMGLGRLLELYDRIKGEGKDIINAVSDSDIDENINKDKTTSRKTSKKKNKGEFD